MRSISQFIHFLEAVAVHWNTHPPPSFGRVGAKPNVTVLLLNVTVSVLLVQ
jgi:hypothetical protein